MTPAGPLLPLPTPELVMFDLDYTLLRPSDQFEAPGYVRTGARFGLELDAARWPQAEHAAYAAARERRRRTGLVHDDGLLPVIAHAIIEGLGGGPPGEVEQTAAAIVDAWGRAENFGLYDDVLPCLGVLRGAGVRMALVSNALGHGLEEVVAHFALDDFICAGVSSASVGVVKPAAALFEAVLVQPRRRRRRRGDGRRQRRGRCEGRARLWLRRDPARPQRSSLRRAAATHRVAGRAAGGAQPSEPRRAAARVLAARARPTPARPPR